MEVSKKKDNLKKLKMPGKPSDPMLEMDDAVADLDSLDAPDAEQAEPLEGTESPEEELKELHELDDEMLVKELEARGYTCQRAEGEGAEPMPGPESSNLEE